MVLSHITMGQHIVAELLRVPEARTMTEHQPGVGPHHRDVVGDVAGVRRAGPDVDHGNAAAPGLDEMESRHLRHALRPCPDWACAAEPRTARDDVAGLD